MFGKKHPEDEGVYVVQGQVGSTTRPGIPTRRYSATRRSLERARVLGRQTTDGVSTDSEYGMRIAQVDVARAWEDLVADDKRLGRR